MRRSLWIRLAGSLFVLLAAESPNLLAEDEPVVHAAVRDLPLDGVNKDGTPFIQLVSQPSPEGQALASPQAQILAQPGGACVLGEPVAVELTPGSCLDYFRSCCLGRHYEPFAPLTASAASHIVSALPGDRLIFRYDNGWSMTHPDRAEWYMARNRGVPGGGGRGLRLPETTVDAQELSTYLEVGLCPRASLFVEMPERFLNAEKNKDYYGWGDLSAGGKFTFCVEETTLETAYFRVTTPTGDASHGLGTGHTSIEFGLLHFERLCPGLTLEAMLLDWIPVDGTISAGNVLHYGAALSFDFYATASHYVKPVVEVEGWTALRGMQTDVYPTKDPDKLFVIESENRDTIINGSIGVRCGGDKGDIYLGYTRAFTGPRWFENGLRLELRWLY